MTEEELEQLSDEEIDRIFGKSPEERLEQHHEWGMKRTTFLWNLRDYLTGEKPDFQPSFEENSILEHWVWDALQKRLKGHNDTATANPE